MSRTFEYSFSYASAPYICYQSTAGFFINITARIGDTLGTPNFQPGSSGSDTLTIPIAQSEQTSPQTLSVCLYNSNSGYTIGQNSTSVLINLVDSVNGTVLASETVQYGFGGITPKEVTKAHEINYISAPYEMAPGNISGYPATAFIITSMHTYSTDSATPPTFVMGSGTVPDSFTANITSNSPTGPTSESTFVNGPFAIDPNSPGVSCQTEVTTDGTKKPPITSPVGIKHYGSSTWHPVHH